MSETKSAIEPLSLKDIAFEHFGECSNSIVEQSQFTPEQQAELGDQLKGSIENRDKLGNVLMWLDGQADLLRTKENQLAERRRNFEKFSWALRSALHQQMLDLGVRKVEGQEFTFTMKKNPPKVEVTDESLIPPEFISYTAVINKGCDQGRVEEGKDSRRGISAIHTVGCSLIRKEFVMRFDSWDRDRFDDEESGGQSSEGGDHVAGGMIPLYGAWTSVAARPTVHSNSRVMIHSSCELSLAKRLQGSGFRVRIGSREKRQPSFPRARNRVADRKRRVDWLAGIVRGLYTLLGSSRPAA
jgi:hypothetical protein